MVHVAGYSILTPQLSSKISGWPELRKIVLKTNLLKVTLSLQGKNVNRILPVLLVKYKGFSDVFQVKKRYRTGWQITWTALYQAIQLGE